MEKLNFNMSTREEKIELLKRLGYTIPERIENWTKEQLDEQLVQNNIINIVLKDNYEFRDFEKPEYSKIVDDSISGTVYKYTLDKFGNLVHLVQNDEPWEADMPVYYHGTEYNLPGFDFPDYAYVFFGDIMYYVGKDGCDVHIKVIDKFGKEKTIVREGFYNLTDTFEYLIDFLILHEKYAAR